MLTNYGRILVHLPYAAQNQGDCPKTTRFRNSSVIAQVFTERFGLQPYLINGVRKPRSSISLNILQPLHLLEMVVYHKPTVSIQRIKEIRNHPVYFSVPLDVIKSTITLFLDRKSTRLNSSH